MDSKIEIVEREDRMTEAGRVLAMRGEMDPEQLEKIAQERVQFFRKLTLYSLQRTTVHDWTDMDGRPYLQSTGAEKLMMLWGIYTQDVKITVEMNPESGFPSYVVTGRVGCRKFDTEIDVIAGRDANDKFYMNQLAKTGHIDLLDVRKAAYSNFLVNGVTRLIGMRGLTWPDIEEFTKGEITKAKATGQAKFEKKAPGPSQPPANAAVGQQAPPEANYQASYITDKQRKRLYAIWKAVGWRDEEVHRLLSARWGIKSTKEIPHDKYEEICKVIEGGTNAN